MQMWESSLCLGAIGKDALGLVKRAYLAPDHCLYDSIDLQKPLLHIVTPINDY